MTPLVSAPPLPSPFPATDQPLVLTPATEADFTEAARLPEEAAMLVEVQNRISQFYGQAQQ